MTHMQQCRVSTEFSCGQHGVGNAICGAIPAGVSVYSCFYNNCTCSAVTHAFQNPDDTCTGHLQPHSLRTNSTPGIQLLHCVRAYLPKLHVCRGSYG